MSSVYRLLKAACCYRHVTECRLMVNAEMEILPSNEVASFEIAAGAHSFGWIAEGLVLWFFKDTPPGHISILSWKKRKTRTEITMPFAGISLLHTRNNTKKSEFIIERGMARMDDLRIHPWTGTCEVRMRFKVCSKGHSNLMPYAAAATSPFIHE